MDKLKLYRKNILKIIIKYLERYKLYILFSSLVDTLHFENIAKNSKCLQEQNSCFIHHIVIEINEALLKFYFWSYLHNKDPQYDKSNIWIGEPPGQTKIRKYIFKKTTFKKYFLCRLSIRNIFHVFKKGIEQNNSFFQKS